MRTAFDTMTEHEGAQQADRLLGILLAREDLGWRALSGGSGADFYERNLTSDALLVFPFGVLTRQQAIEAMRAAPPWSSYRLGDPRVTEVSAKSAILTYCVAAWRSGEQPYAAHITTVFVLQEGVWKTAFHQHTPVDD